MFTVSKTSKKVTTFFINSQEMMNKWLHQNAAVFLDCVEGVLLDSSIVGTKNGTAAIYEHYVSPWRSNYLVEFQRGDALTVWNNWEKFASVAAAEEMGT